MSDETFSEPHLASGPPIAARIGFLAAPVLAIAVYFLLPGGSEGLSHAARACGGVATLMAVWWMTEALPLEATALLPLVLLPLSGVYTGQIEPGDVVQIKSHDTTGVVVAVNRDEKTAEVSSAHGAVLKTPLKFLSKDSPFKKAAAPFADPAIFLFLGGFAIALAIERWGLHRRMALLTILAVGTSPSRLVAGFMLATGAISMWISNTATTVMMLPIGLAVVHLLSDRLRALTAETIPLQTGANLGIENPIEELRFSANPKTVSLAVSPGESGKNSDASNFSASLLLGIAYAASLGGFATLVGTPPNVFFKGYMYDRGIEIDFGRWMLFATPVSIIYLTLAWWLMTTFLFPVKIRAIPGGRDLIIAELKKLGAVSRGEWIVLTVFLVTAALWTFGQQLKSNAWLTAHLPAIKAVDDYLIAMFGAIILFLIPVDPARHIFALDWKTAVKLPWGVLLLFGGGLSLATALTDSGLAAWIGEQVRVLRTFPTYWQIVIVVALIVFSGELTNNLAAVVAMLPILFQVAAGMQLDPLLFCVPAVIAASCGFMLPVATPPNAIVFGTGHIKLGQMVRTGFWLDLLAIVLIPLATYLLGAQVLGIKM
jgi:sodium-dependent dicarboxylate transporter 2/3/5